MARKVHPADAAEAARIARATSFAAYFRKSPAERYRIEAPTLTDARAAAAQMDAEHGKFGRRAVIYAITPEGQHAVVPDDWPDIIAP